MVEAVRVFVLEPGLSGPVGNQVEIACRTNLSKRRAVQHERAVRQRPNDNSAELIDGTKFSGPDQLKKVLLDRKELFVRNLVGKMLGYALGRGLTLKDSCTVDSIVAKMRDNDYSALTMVEAIVLSVPFQMQAPAPPGPQSQSMNSGRVSGQKEPQKP